jgi:hypothetical protein
MLMHELCLGDAEFEAYAHSTSSSHCHVGLTGNVFISAHYLSLLLAMLLN